MRTGLEKVGYCAAFLVAVCLLAVGQTNGTFQSGGKTVAIERFDPESKGEHAAVMVVHGAGGPDAGWRKSGVVQALNAAGYTVFAPHYFDAGGVWDWSGAGDKFFAYIRALNDASRYIGTQPGIRKDGIALVGFSLGGVLVLGAAEETVSHPPPAEQAGLPIKAVVDNYGYMPEFAAPRMTTMAPVLILHGDKDEVVPVARAYETEKLLKSKSVPYEMKIYPGQGHGFSGDDLKDADRRTVEFIRKYLK